MKRWHQLSQRMFSNSMRSGLLCTRRLKNVGYGQPCAVERDKLLLSSSVIGAKQHVNCCGKRSRKHTSIVRLTATFGKHMWLSFRKKHITVLVRRVVKPITWSAEITRSGNGMLVMFVRRCPFQRPISFTNWSPDFLSSDTISISYHLSLKHHPSSNDYQEK